MEKELIKAFQWYMGKSYKKFSGVAVKESRNPDAICEIHNILLGIAEPKVFCLVGEGELYLVTNKGLKKQSYIMAVHAYRFVEMLCNTVEGLVSCEYMMGINSDVIKLVTESNRFTPKVFNIKH